MSGTTSPLHPPAAPGGRAVPQRPFPALGRRGLLVVGLCFGLAYGVTQRILSLDLGEWRPLSHPFDVKPSPGTSLETLRLRFGDSGRPIRADLEALELEKANREAAERRQREQADQERQLREEEQRLERAQELPLPQAGADGAAPSASAPSELAPAAPTLPPAPEAQAPPPVPPAPQP